MSQHSETGKWGEALAVDFFAKKNFKIEATNWHWHNKEIDLIVSNQREIIFVEVKTRTAGVLAKPEEALTRAKQKHLLQAANAYIIDHDINKEARFDVITIWINGKQHNLKHTPNAFGPQW
ncbi:MAG TPA: YraN family protein [Salinivirga sp.]|uniref:YraN family protein n=1 Tax=Salinivirga sp. TaxID=1970192 RepID=UPI002B487789|nr:YraN family protein [Salinivirga sp.]HKK57864.1 YraN family protein [Salinivirga sp.]